MSKIAKLTIVWLTLLVLLALTVWVWSFQIPVWGTLIGLLIAFLKACLVVAFFMHLSEESRLVCFLAGGASFWLIVLCGITLADYFTRG